MFDSNQPLVGIIMGSKSDWETMEAASLSLNTFGIPHERRVVSAHRTPEWMVKYAQTAEERGLKVIIAGAGGIRSRQRLERSAKRDGRCRRSCNRDRFEGIVQAGEFETIGTERLRSSFPLGPTSNGS